VLLRKVEGSPNKHQTTVTRHSHTATVNKSISTNSRNGSG